MSERSHSDFLKRITKSQMFSLFKTVSAEVETLANLEIMKIILFRIRIIMASVIKTNYNGIDHQKHNGQTSQNQSSNS